MALCIEGLTKSFARPFSQPRRILDDVSFTVEAGEASFVRGQNGSGKSTLLRCVASLLERDAGTIAWHGVSLRSAQVGYIFDNPRFLRPRLTAHENLAYYGALAGVTAPDFAQRAARLCDALAVEGPDRPVNTLSKGNLQKVNIAFAFALDRPIVVCDEPTSFLDTDAALVLTGLLREHAEGGGALLISTHDTALIRGLGGKELALAEGRLVDGAALVPRLTSLPSTITADARRRRRASALWWRTAP